MKSIAFGIIALAVSADAAQAEPLQIWSPDAIIWQQDRPGSTKRAVLEGSLESHGKIVTYAFHMPDGAWFPAHSHASTSRVFVLKGTLLLGEGPSGDRARVHRIHMGEAAIVPGGMVHYEGAEGDTVLVGVATGPWTTTFITEGTGITKGVGVAKRIGRKKIHSPDHPAR